MHFRWKNSMSLGTKWVNCGFQGVARSAGILKHGLWLPIEFHEFLSCCEYTPSPVMHTETLFQSIQLGGFASAHSCNLPL